MSNSTPQNEANIRLQNYENKKRDFSEKVSETLRTLAFAEIALFWMLLKEFHYREYCVYFGLLFLIIYFAVDTLQYIAGMLCYKYLCKKTRVQIDNKQYSTERINNDGVNILPNALFWIKLVLMIISIVILAVAMHNTYPNI